jgi:hypothetical protein
MPTLIPLFGGEILSRGVEFDVAFSVHLSVSLSLEYSR